MEGVKVEWKVLNAKQFMDNLNDLGRTFGKNQLERAAIAGGRVISYEAERRAPKDTGKASKTIRARIWRTEPGEVEVIIGPDRKGYYLMFHEWGSKHQRARPFLRPSLEDKQDEAMQVMGDYYRDRIERQLRRAKK